jgi:hypothetical protein
MYYLNWALTVYTGLIIVAKLYVAYILIWYICMCIRHFNYFEKERNKKRPHQLVQLFLLFQLLTFQIAKSPPLITPTNGPLSRPQRPPPVSPFLDHTNRYTICLRLCLNKCEPYQPNHDIFFQAVHFHRICISTFLGLFPLYLPKCCLLILVRKCPNNTE